MNESVQYDAALAAGLLIMELVDSSPGAPKTELLKHIIFVVHEAIHEAARRQENRHAEPFVK